MPRTPEQLIKEAEELKVGKPREFGYKDDKMLVSIDEFIGLLEAGGRCFKINAPSGVGYISEMFHSGYRFQAYSEEPIKRLYM